MPQPDPGPIVLHSDVETAVKDTLERWVPYYLARVDEQLELEPCTTEPPRSYSIASENDRWLEETPPALMVVCPGTVGDPERHGDDASYGAWWQVNVGVTVGGATEAGGRKLAGRHAGALLLTLAQQSDMGGLAQRTRWLGFRTDVLDRSRKLVACEALAHVYVRHVVSTRGPLLPKIPPEVPCDPADPLPDIVGHRVRVTVTEEE